MFQRFVTRPTGVPSGNLIVGSYGMKPFERALVAATGASGPPLIFAPSGPSNGDQFGVKVIVGTGAWVSGNGKMIEMPTGPYALAATGVFGGSGPGGAATWEYQGSGWNVVAFRQ